MKIEARTFVLMYFGAQTDDLRWSHLGCVEHMESHWAIDDHGCYYLIGQQEPEQPQWPPVHADSEVWKQDDEGTLVVAGWFAEKNGLV